MGSHLHTHHKGQNHLFAVCPCRLRCLVKQLERGEVNVVDLKKNIEYAASVLEAVYIDETR